MNPKKFFGELKRRNVYKVAIAYAIVAWLLIQIATQVFPFFEIPNWAVRLVVLLLIIGFPVALILAWAFELTPEGIKRTEDLDVSARHVPKNRAWIYVVLTGGAMSILLFLLGRYTALKERRTVASVEKSIAVLPFENLSHDPENAYFADGIQEEILTRLSKIADLKVISRTSTERFKSAPQNLREIAAQLGVANILEGSAQRVADQVRVNVQLINAMNDAHLWAETYDRKLTDIFAVESNIANTIAETLQAKLTGAEKWAISSPPTENAEAHLLYLKGRYHVQKLSKEELNKGLDYFKQAVALDPGYALAYDGIAYYHFVAIDWLAPVSDLGPAWMEAARKAVELDDRLAESHTELANAYFWYDWNWAAAEQEFKRAIQLDPKYAPAHEYYAWYLVLAGRVDDGVAEFRRALEIEPLSAESNALFGWNLWVARRYDAAIEQLRKALDLDPSNWWAHANMGRCHLSQGTPSNAITDFQKAISIENSIAEPVAGLGMAYAALGNKAEAMRVLNELQERGKQNYVSSYFIASVYGALGEKDQAFAWLDKAYENRSWYLLALKLSPEVDNLRSDPRFKKLVARVFGNGR